MFVLFFFSRYTYCATGWAVQSSNLGMGKKFFAFSKMADTSKILYQTINSRLIGNRKK